MKHVFSLLLLASASAIAAPPTPPAFELPPPPLATQFRTFGAGLPLPEFLRVTVGEILRSPYVLTPAVSTETALISADLSRVKPADLLAVVREVLRASGYSLELTRGVYVVDKLQPATPPAPKSERFVYTPRYRSVSELSSYAGLFPSLSLSAPAANAATARATDSQTTAPTVTRTQSARVAADSPRLAYSGTPDDIAAFRAFLTDVDVPVPQVTVRAYVLEVRSTTADQGGVSLAASILADRLKLSTPAVAGTSSLTLSLGSAGNSVSLAVAALSSDSRVRLLSSPVLRAADGSSASATVGTETPTLGAVTTQNGASVQSVSYQSSGVLLTISPRVYRDSIRLQVSQEISSFVQTDTGLSGTPTKLRRAFDSDLVAAPGDVVLLGGLSETKSSSANARGFLGFGSRSDDESQSDIVVLLSIERV